MHKKNAAMSNACLDWKGAAVSHTHLLRVQTRLCKLDAEDAVDGGALLKKQKSIKRYLYIVVPNLLAHQLIQAEDVDLVRECCCLQVPNTSESAKGEKIVDFICYPAWRFS